jgi:hypothetical protein
MYIETCEARSEHPKGENQKTKTTNGYREKPNREK